MGVIWKLGLDEKTEGKSRYELAETSFKTVLDCDIHEDNKASRILTAMAFLTAAAAGIFAKAYSSDNDSQLWVLAVFSLYMFFVFLGASLYLTALGPALNIPLHWSKKGEEKEPKSLLFFKLITDIKEEAWKKYWKEQETISLEEKMTDDFIYETYLIAQKVKTKLFRMVFGSFFFKIAILFLIPLVVAIIPFQKNNDFLYWIPIVDKSKFIIWLGLATLFGIFIYESWNRPPQNIAKVPETPIWCILYVITFLAFFRESFLASFFVGSLIISIFYILTTGVKIKFVKVVFGSFFFKIAILFLIPLAVTLVPSQEINNFLNWIPIVDKSKFIIWFSLLLGLLILFGIFIYMYMKKSKNYIWCVLYFYAIAFLAFIREFFIVSFIVIALIVLTLYLTLTRPNNSEVKE
jgi:hypothetical protein